MLERGGKSLVRVSERVTGEIDDDQARGGVWGRMVVNKGDAEIGLTKAPAAGLSQRRCGASSSRCSKCSSCM